MKKNGYDMVVIGWVYLTRMTNGSVTVGHTVILGWKWERYLYTHLLTPWVEI